MPLGVSASQIVDKIVVEGNKAVPAKDIMRVISLFEGDEYKVAPDYYGDCTPLEFEYLRSEKSGR